ncbi:ROK family protein [Candidatus Bathyarchaeota archaeon]|nr:ROK family protein [Candidatus Bathyarchaeota archaeon]
MCDQYFIAVDIGATRIRAALFKSSGEMIQKVEALTPRDSPDAPSRKIIELINSFKFEVSLKDKIQGVGIGSIGPLDLKKGMILVAPNLNLREIPIVDPIEEELGLPVALHNDCTTAVVGEKAFGAGKNVDNLVYVTISTGIGGGVYVDGHLLVGKDGNAAEVGHFVVDNKWNLKCGCGGIGHWEAYCSGKNLPRFVKILIGELKTKDSEKRYLMESCNSDLDKLTAKAIYEGAEKGDPLCLKILDEVNDLNARGFACIINAYDPELISVGGAITLNHPDLMLNPIIKGVKKYIAVRVPKMMVTPLGEDIVLYGAFALIKQSLS